MLSGIVDRLYTKSQLFNARGPAQLTDNALGTLQESESALTREDIVHTRDGPSAPAAFSCYNPTDYTDGTWAFEHKKGATQQVAPFFTAYLSQPIPSPSRSRCVPYPGEPL